MCPSYLNVSGCSSVFEVKSVFLIVRKPDTFVCFPFYSCLPFLRMCHPSSSLGLFWYPVWEVSRSYWKQASILSFHQPPGQGFNALCIVVHSYTNSIVLISEFSHRSFSFGPYQMHYCLLTLNSLGHTTTCWFHFFFGLLLLVAHHGCLFRH